MKRINYKSDFDLIVRLKDCEGAEVPWPDCDWDVKFWTSGMASYTASYNSATGKYVNCFPEADGSMHFVFDSHGMGIGELKWQPHFAFENPAYTDGYKDTFSRAALDIELVVVGEDCPNEAAETLVVIPWQYLHDTDVYNEILERVNGILEEVLGEGGAPIPASGGNSGASGQYILRSGMLNLRDTHDTVCRAKQMGPRGAKRYIVKLVLNKEVSEYDLSEWFNEGDVVDVCPMNWEDKGEGVGVYAKLDGLTLRIIRSGGYSSRVAVAIVLRDNYFGGVNVQYIRMSKGKIAPVSAATQDSLPRIGFTDAVNIVKDDSQRDNRLNGYHFQIQRRRANSHWRDDEAGLSVHEKHRKWREWKKYAERPNQSKKTLVYRVRYKSGTGRVGPWTYISKRKNNYDEI